MSATAEVTKVRPFTIEADHPRNCDLLIQSIPGCKLRGAVSASKPAYTREGQPPMIPRDQARHLGALPPIPGMRLTVNPEACTYMITDPLHDDEALCRQIEAGLKREGRVVGKVEGVPPKSGKLDVHRMKTLCRELAHLVNIGHARVVKGQLPTKEQIDGMPGNYLLNPGSRVPNTQPRFEKDFDEWVARLNQQGG